MALQSVSCENKSDRTSSPVEMTKQPTPTSNTPSSEEKENQSVNMSTKSIASNRVFVKRTTDDSAGSRDEDDPQSSLVACQLLKRQEEQLKQMQLQVSANCHL